jgi:GT2 family glycosyltransferase
VIALKQLVESEPGFDIWNFRLQEFGESHGIYDGGGDPADLKDRNSIPGVSWFRRSVWVDLNGFRECKAVDWEFWLRAYLAGKRFRYSPEIVYYMNVHRDSDSRSYKVPFSEIKSEVFRVAGVDWRKL